MNTIKGWRENSKIKEIVDFKYIALMCGFSLAVFSIFEIYLTNISEFWFGLKEMGLISITAFAFLFILLIIIMGVLTLINQKLGIAFSVLVFSINISLYIQGTYANADYGILNGKEIDWEKYGQYGAVSILIFIIPFMVSILIIKIKGENLYKKFTKVISICLILIQTVTLITLFFTVNISNKENEKSLSNSNLLQISNNKNILLICLDSFDSYDYKQLLEESDEYELDDFVYYQNTAGAYPSTVAAIPHILTGKWYDNTMIKDKYLEEAYRDTPLYRALQQKNYSIGIYTDNIYVSDEIKDYIENAKKIDYIPRSYLQLSKKIYTLAAFKYVPSQLKRIFWFYPGEFTKMKAMKSGVNFGPYSGDTQEFYQDLLNKRIEVSKDTGNSFKFYHIEGTHSPYTFGEDLTDIEDATVIDEAKGNIKLLKEFITQLKTGGIYDNTAIIVLADHGHYDYCNNPLLLIKDFGSNKLFQTSDAPISYEDLVPTMYYWITGEKKNDTIFDVAEEQERIRRFFWYSWTVDSKFTADYLPKMEEYFIKGKAYETGSLFKSGNVYEDGNHIVQIYKFENEKVVYFDGGDDYTALVQSGYSIPEKDSNGVTHCWSLGESSQIRIQFDNPLMNDLLVSIEASSLTAEQVIEVYVNGKYLTTIEDIKSQFQFTIPNEYLKGERKLEIKFDYPQAISPRELGINDDLRVLAILYKSIMFSEVD